MPDEEQGLSEAEKDAQRKVAFQQKVAAERRLREASKEKTKQLKRIALAVVAVAVVGGAVWLLSQQPPAQPATNEQATGFASAGQPIHWHPELSIAICGQEVALKPETGQMPGIHTHTDMPKIHLELVPQTERDITLGRAMDDMGLRFDGTHLLDKSNGDSCGGTPGRVHMWVDGAEREPSRDLVLADGMKVRLAFE